MPRDLETHSSGGKPLPTVVVLRRAIQSKTVRKAEKKISKQGALSHETKVPGSLEGQLLICRDSKSAEGQALREIASFSEWPQDTQSRPGETRPRACLACSFDLKLPCPSLQIHRP